MNETSTPISKRTMQATSSPAMPRRSTINFLKGFARAYVAERRLQSGILGLVLN